MPPWVNSASAIFVVSITEPPPTARNESAPASLATSAHLSQTSVEESCGTSSKMPGDLEAALLDPGDDLVDQTRLADHLVGHDEDALGALLHELEARTREQVAAGDDARLADCLEELLETAELAVSDLVVPHYASMRSVRPFSSSIVR